MDAAAKLEIHELLSRAAYALDEQDLDMLGACFAADAEFHMQIAGQPPIAPFLSHDAIMGLMRNSIAAQTDKRRHVVSNIFFASGGEAEAEVVSNLTLFGTENGAIRLISTALYRDRVVRRDGRWVLATRRIELDLPY